MNENVILNDFLQLKEDGVITEKFATYEELLDVLSGRFSDIYDNSDDGEPPHLNFLRNYRWGFRRKLTPSSLHFSSPTA